MKGRIYESEVCSQMGPGACYCVISFRFFGSLFALFLVSDRVEWRFPQLTIVPPAGTGTPSNFSVRRQGIELPSSGRAAQADVDDRVSNMKGGRETLYGVPHAKKYRVVLIGASMMPS